MRLHPCVCIFLAMCKMAEHCSPSFSTFLQIGLPLLDD